MHLYQLCFSALIITIADPVPHIRITGTFYLLSIGVFTIVYMNTKVCIGHSVPDFLALSLLVENNSTDFLEIKIVAPAFVNLEQSQVQLNAKEHKLVYYTSSHSELFSIFG
jgi:hypothetical protein